MFTGLFVDDIDGIYADLLSTDGELQVAYMPVSELSGLAAEVIAARPIILAIDYRLDEHTPALAQTFKASGLAQLIRDKAIDNPSEDCAMVLVSAEDNINKLYQPDKTAHDLFDEIYKKSDVADQSRWVQARMVGLCKGYEILRTEVGKFDFFNLACVSESEREFVDIQELQVAISGAAAPHVVARSFLKNLISRSGILYQIGDVLARLGCAPESESVIKPKIEAMRYTGLFSSPWERWWAYQLEDWATELFGQPPASLTAAARASILSQKLNVKAEPARSTWNKSMEELVSFSCACCLNPTEMRHSVAAFEEHPVRFLERKRICWDCVQTEKYRRINPPLLIANEDKKIAKKAETLSRDGT